jgi:hypothetical protein
MEYFLMLFHLRYQSGALNGVCERLRWGHHFKIELQVQVEEAEELQAATGPRRILHTQLSISHPSVHLTSITVATSSRISLRRRRLNHGRLLPPAPLAGLFTERSIVLTKSACIPWTLRCHLNLFPIPSSLPSLAFTFISLTRHSSSERREDDDWTSP